MNDLEVILKALQRERDDLHGQLLQLDRIIKRVKTGTYSDEALETIQAPKQLEVAPVRKTPLPSIANTKIQVLKVFDVLGVACTLKQLQAEYTAMTGDKSNIRDIVRSLQKSTLVKLMKVKPSIRGIMWVKSEWVIDGQLEDSRKPDGFDVLYDINCIIYE